ncbi:MAG: RusA family crossover junction endodeoxyribonuclease [Gemmatimonadaceae bacterium]|nr:RusA family crossover junction endodeoxyribonuclease [Gemmatimonadaceae bacterium]
MTRYELVVPGVARAKGRPRFGGGRAYTPAGTRSWEEFVGWTWVAAHGNTRLTGPIAIELDFNQVRADLDNLVKAILDAMNGIAYVDDSQVVDIVARKRWPGTKVRDPETRIVLISLASEKPRG